MKKTTFDFKCKKCGMCCFVDGYVALSPAEEQKIASYIGVSLTRFRRDFTEKIPGVRRRVLVLYEDGCAFLINNKCIIYPVRPGQCREFPYWKDIVDGGSALIKAASYCKGIKIRKKPAEKWWVYMVRCKNRAIYTGIAKNVAKRVSHHNSGKGAKYTRANGPVELVYCEEARDVGYALKRERQIKGYTKAKKEKLVKMKTED
jgi:putative endonuclease